MYTQQEFDLFSILPEDKIPEKGRLLISVPFLPDNFFNRSIVFLTEHTSEGSVGFILNKKIDLRVCDTVDGFDNWEEFLNMGGPVAPDTLHYIHTLGTAIPGSVHVHGNIFWSGEIDAVRSLISFNKVKPHQIRFFLGYSGWSAGQLERELKENSWVIAQVNTDIIMAGGGPGSWKRVLKGLNKKYRAWADFPESPDMN